MSWQDKLKPKGAVQQVMGHRIPEPRPTWQGIVLLIIVISVPVLLLGSLLDAVAQWLFGVCTGLWCFI